MQKDNSLLSNLTQQNASNSNGLIQNAQSYAPQPDANGLIDDPLGSGQKVDANTFISNDQIKQNQQQQPTQAATPAADNGDGGNFLTKLLPMLGSIALPTIGALLAPETGGLSLMAGLGLAGAGSGAGKFAENAIEGKKDLLDNVGGEALSGAGGQLVGAGIGKVLGAGAGALGNIAEGGIVKAGTEAAAQDATKVAQKTRDTWMGVKKAVLENNDLAGKQALASKLGIDINDPQAWVNTSNSANDILNNVVNEALTKGGKVDMGDYDNVVKGILAKYQGTLGSLDPVAVGRGQLGLPNNAAGKLYQQLRGLGRGFNGDGTALVSGDPVAARNLISKIGSIGADAKPGVSAATGAIDPIQKDTYNAIQDLYGTLKGKVYDRPEVTDTIGVLKGNITPEDVGGNANLAAHINEIISNAKSPQDVLDGIKSFTEMNQLGNAGVKVAQNPASAQALRDARQDLPGAGMNAYQTLESAMGSAIPGKGGILASVADAAKKAIGAVGAGGKTSETAAKLADTLTGASRFVPGATNAGVAGTVAGQVVAGAPNFQGPAGTNNAVDMLNMPVATGDPYTDIMNSTAPGSEAAKMALINSQFTPVGGSGGNPLDSTAVTDFLKQQQAINTARSQVDDYISSLNASGGAQGMFGGLMAKLGGMITGGPAAGAEMQRQALEQSLAQALGHPVSLPGMTLNQTAANNVLGQLQAQLNSAGGYR